MILDFRGWSFRERLENVVKDLNEQLRLQVEIMCVKFYIEKSRMEDLSRGRFKEGICEYMIGKKEKINCVKLRIVVQ